MKPITQKYDMNATPGEVFEALTNPAVIQKWSGAPAKMDDKAGTQFSLFGGNIAGSNLEVVPHQKLVQEWYSGEWESPSRVTFSLVATDGGTVVELLHENVPEVEVADISEGWKKYYLGQIQRMFAR